jgi:hypothetical protein
MKQKDIMYLMLAVVILLAAGYIGYTQLMPKKSASTGVEVEKVGVIPSTLDETGMSLLKDPAKSQDFNSPVDLSGLGNAAIFGP